MGSKPGLLYLASTAAIIRIRFAQRFLTEPPDLVGREVANCIFRQVNSLGLSEALFLNDLQFLSTGGLSPFYGCIFRSCTWLKWAHSGALEAEAPWQKKEPSSEVVQSESST